MNCRSPVDMRMVAYSKHSFKSKEKFRYDKINLKNFRFVKSQILQKTVKKKKRKLSRKNTNF